MQGFADDSINTAVPVGTACVHGHRVAAPESLRTGREHGQVSYVRLEIRTDALYNLLNNKALVIEDLRGLDRQAKTWLRKRLLETLLL